MRLIKKIQPLYAIMIALAVMFFISRIAIIENDIPPFYISHYQPIDEFYYAIKALDYVENGQYNYHFNNLDIGSARSIGVNHLLNGMVIFFVELSGDNYFGFRLSALVCGLFTFIITLYIINALVTIHAGSTATIETSRIGIVVFCGLLLLTDFSFILSNIVIEPTIVRLTVVMCLILFVERNFSGQTGLATWPLFVLGIIATLSWALVYVANAFIILACLVFILKTTSGFSVAYRLAKLAVFTSGVAAACLGLCIAAFLAQADYASDIQEILGFGGERLSDGETPFYFSAIKKLLSILKANFLSFNPFMLLLFFPVVALSLFRMYKGSNTVIFNITASFLFAFFIQCLFINDFPERKDLIIFPIFLILIIDNLFYIMNSRSLQHYIQSRKALAIVCAGLYILLVAMFMIVLHITRHPFCFSVDYFHPGWFLCAVFLLPLMRRLTFSAAISGIVMICLMPAVYYSFVFIYQYPVTRMKEAMQSLQDLPGESVVAGGVSMAYRLYNSNFYAVSLYRYVDMTDKYYSDMLSLRNSDSIDYMISDEITPAMNFPIELEPVKLLNKHNCRNSNFILYKIK